MAAEEGPPLEGASDSVTRWASRLSLLYTEGVTSQNEQQENKARIRRLFGRSFSYYGPSKLRNFSQTCRQPTTTHGGSSLFGVGSAGPTTSPG